MSENIHKSHNVSKLMYHFVLPAKEVFARCPEVKKQLWGGNFRTAGYYVSTVSEHGNEEVIAYFVKNHGNEYKKLFRNKEPEGQFSIFDYM